MNKFSIIVVIVIILLLFGIIGGCTEDSEYEKAGKSFGSWVNSDPNGWSDSQKEYFNDYMDWIDNN